MAGEVVRRRMSMIAAHFASGDEISPAAHLLPMNCSTSCLNSVMRRCDNRMYFARQGSASQAFFMRQVSTEQLCQDKPEKPALPPKCSSSANQCSFASDAPSFSRPTTITRNSGAIQPPVLQDCKTCDLPNFARPNRGVSSAKQFQYSKNQLYPSRPNGIFEWSPRMDVVESGCNYVVTVEIPGVNISDIRVEVNDQNLAVRGERSTQCWRQKAAGCTNESVSSYHKREILQGPYKVVWPLPSHVNRDSVSAEFLDGILQIIVPKL